VTVVVYNMWCHRRDDFTPGTPGIQQVVTAVWIRHYLVYNTWCHWPSLTVDSCISTSALGCIVRVCIYIYVCSVIASDTIVGVGNICTVWELAACLFKGLQIQFVVKLKSLKKTSILAIILDKGKWSVRTQHFTVTYSRWVCTGQLFVVLGSVID
jgi:hypothetical protein